MKKPFIKTLAATFVVVMSMAIFSTVTFASTWYTASFSVEGLPANTEFTVSRGDDVFTATVTRTGNSAYIEVEADSCPFKVGADYYAYYTDEFDVSYGENVEALSFSYNDPFKTSWTGSNLYFTRKALGTLESYVNCKAWTRPNFDLKDKAGNEIIGADNNTELEPGSTLTFKTASGGALMFSCLNSSTTEGDTVSYSISGSDGVVFAKSQEIDAEIKDSDVFFLPKADTYTITIDEDSIANGCFTWFYWSESQYTNSATNGSIISDGEYYYVVAKIPEEKLKGKSQVTLGGQTTDTVYKSIFACGQTVIESGCYLYCVKIPVEKVVATDEFRNILDFTYTVS